MHPARTAATRLRVLQHAPALRAADVHLEVWTFLRDRDLDGWFGPSSRGRAVAAARGLLRVPAALRAIRRADIVLVQREAMPLGPPLLERLAARRRPLVWDVDDAVWAPYVSPTAGRVPRWLRVPGDKFATIARRSSQVWAGSEVLAEWCRHHAADVVVVPTVVPVPVEAPVPSGERTVGWIGSHSTGGFVEAVLPHVRRVEPVPRALVVGADVAVPVGLPAEVRGWSPAEEARALTEIRVGLYPIDREHPLAEGKCGLKAILFMSAGIPVVVTPTTTNAAIVRDGIEGLYATTAEEWTAAVARLLDDRDLWERCSRAAHARALEGYSLDAWGPRIASMVRAVGEDQTARS